MRLPRVRFTVRTLMVAVALAGLFCFNVRLLAGIETDLPPADPGRVRLWRIAALAVSPIVAGLAAWAAWRLSTELIGSRRRSAARGGIAGAAAGGSSWYVATIALCIGHAADGQTQIAATILGIEGAILNAALGALLAALLSTRPGGPGPG